MQNSSCLSEAVTKKNVFCCSKTSMRHVKKVTRSFQGLFERIMTFQQEVTILSHDMPTKVVISPLLPLNGCATVVEKVFSWDEDKNG